MPSIGEDAFGYGICKESCVTNNCNDYEHTKPNNPIEGVWPKCQICSGRFSNLLLAYGIFSQSNAELIPANHDRNQFENFSKLQWMKLTTLLELDKKTAGKEMIDSINIAQMRTMSVKLNS